MIDLRSFLFYVCCIAVGVSRCACLPRAKALFRTNDTAIVLDFLRDIETRGSNLSIIAGEASWDYFTDLTPEKNNLSIAASSRSIEYFLKASENASTLLKDHVDLPLDLARQVRLMSLSAQPKSSQDIEALEKLQSKMTATYSNGKACRKKSNNVEQCLPLDPDLGLIMSKSRDYDELLWAWVGWRDAVGPPLRDQFRQLVDLLNKGAQEHKWGDYGHFMRSVYEMGNDLTTTLESLWSAVKPLYEELHSYVRFKLHKKYPKISPDGPIQAHVLGNMWSQDWSDIYDIVAPFPEISPLDVTPNLEEQNYTAVKMFELAQSFFVSLGLYPMPESFWDKSVLSKPENRSIVCHASAWGFKPGDVRIKMCTGIHQNDLITAHHEMGHVEYYLAYRHLPFAYRDGANPGFHEAIGDTIALSVETPKYLKSVNLLSSYNSSDAATVNFLLMQALRRVAQLPFTYLVDQWRWQVLAGKIGPSDYNAEWWKIRLHYQGLVPPVNRTEKDFDPGAKFHIASNSAYIGYFVSLILQFQFHRSLCGLAKHKGPLHECSIFKSKEAGEKFKEMLEAGKSEPWPQILSRLTGDLEMTASALLEYFEPLRKWLYTYRLTHKYSLGWQQPVESRDVNGVRKSATGNTSWTPKNSKIAIKLPDLQTAMKQMQPDRLAKKKNNSHSLISKSSIESAKPMFLPNKVKDQLNLG